MGCNVEGRGSGDDEADFAIDIVAHTVVLEAVEGIVLLVEHQGYFRTRFDSIVVVKVVGHHNIVDLHGFERLLGFFFGEVEHHGEVHIRIFGQDFDDATLGRLHCVATFQPQHVLAVFQDFVERYGIAGSSRKQEGFFHAGHPFHRVLAVLQRHLFVRPRPHKADFCSLVRLDGA